MNKKIPLAVAALSAIIWWLHVPESEITAESCAPIVYYNGTIHAAHHESDYFYDPNCVEWTKGGECAPDAFIAPSQNHVLSSSYAESNAGPEYSVPAPKTFTDSLIYGQRSNPDFVAIPDRSCVVNKVDEPNALVLIFTAIAGMILTARGE